MTLFYCGIIIFKISVAGYIQEYHSQNHIRAKKNQVQVPSGMNK